MTSKTDEATGAADALGYEQARDELIEVVRRLEAGGTTLEESLALWERGEELSKVCRPVAGRGAGQAGRRPGRARGRRGRRGRRPGLSPGSGGGGIPRPPPYGKL